MLLLKQCFYSLFLACLLFSCASRKKFIYLNNLADSVSNIKVKQFDYAEPIIQVDDILSISILTIDPKTSSVLNQVAPSIPSVGTSSANAIGSQVVNGFLVNKEGNIELPMIGILKVGGLSTFEARELIYNSAILYYKNPTVQVRFANYKISIIGEIAKPATYTLPNEKVSVLDIICLAGDLTIYGKRENVLLIREVNGEKIFARFNLNSTEIFKSPYFYLKQNDIVYVEPNKHKIIGSSAYRNRNITIIASAISLMIILLYRIN